MIWKVWLRLFLVILFVTLPLALAQVVLQKQTIEVAFDVLDRATPVEWMDSSLKNLNTLLNTTLFIGSSIKNSSSRFGSSSSLGGSAAPENKLGSESPGTDLAKPPPGLGPFWNDLLFHFEESGPIL